MNTNEPWHFLVSMMSPSCHSRPFGSYWLYGHLDSLPFDPCGAASPRATTLSSPSRARAEGRANSLARVRGLVRHGPRDGRPPSGDLAPVKPGVPRTRPFAYPVTVLTLEVPSGSPCTCCPHFACSPSGSALSSS